MLKSRLSTYGSETTVVEQPEAHKLLSDIVSKITCNTTAKNGLKKSETGSDKSKSTFKITSSNSLKIFSSSEGVCSEYHKKKQEVLPEKPYRHPSTKDAPPHKELEKSDSSGVQQRTALIMASVFGHTENIERILTETPNSVFNDRDWDGKTALIVASEHGHTKSVEKLLTYKADVNAGDSKGRTALIFASLNGYTDCVELLIDNGADVNAADNRGCTALIAACQFGHKHTANALISHDANIHAADNNSWTASMVASKLGDIDLSEMLEKRFHKFPVRYSGVLLIKYIINTMLDPSSYPFTLKIDDFPEPIEFKVTKKLAEEMRNIGKNITVVVSDNYLQECEKEDIKLDTSREDFWKSRATPYLFSIEPHMLFTDWPIHELPTLSIPLLPLIEVNENINVSLFCSQTSIIRNHKDQLFSKLSAKDFYLCKEGEDFYCENGTADLLYYQLLHFSSPTTFFTKIYQIYCLVKEDIESTLPTDGMKFIFRVDKCSERVSNESLATSGFKIFGDPIFVTYNYFGTVEFEVECIGSTGNWLSESKKSFKYQDQSLSTFLSDDRYHENFTLTLNQRYDPDTRKREARFSLSGGAEKIPFQICGNFDYDHIMVSYAWGNNNKWQPLVSRFVEIMRTSYKFDIWQDIDGSRVLDRLANFSHFKEGMSEAASKSRKHAIIFISTEYFKSGNCVNELRLLAEQDTRLHFITLEKKYIEPRNRPTKYRGYLAGNFLFELYNENQIENKAKEVAEAINGAKCSNNQALHNSRTTTEDDFDDQQSADIQESFLPVDKRCCYFSNIC